MKNQNQILTPDQIKELETILAFHKWDDDDTYLVEPTVEFEFRDDELRLEVTNMYNGDNASFSKRAEKFQKAADYLGYRHWDLFDEISVGGCDTCDYGSSYGYILVFWN